MLTMTNLDAVQAHPMAIPSDFTVRCAEYADWNDQNPQVVQSFFNMTLKTIAENRGRYAARTILELIRWHTPTAETNSSFKLNNNLVGLLARHFVLKYPQYDGFFAERSMKGEPKSREVSQAILRNALRRQQGFLF